jgi:cytohesin
MDTHKCNDLFEAILEKHTECIQKLLVVGTDPNVVDNHGWTPLHYVAYRGYDAQIQMLVDAGANPDVFNTNGDTPLHCAVSENHDACVEQLIAAGANVNAIAEGSWSSLHIAIARGHDSCVQKLIVAGADLNIANDEGWTPLHMSISKVRFDTCFQKLIAAGADPNVAHIQGTTPLHRAAYTGCVAFVKTLIAAGANPDVRNADGTPLQIAVKKGYKKCAKMLAVSVLANRALTDDEWDLVPMVIDLGHLLPVVMARDGRDAAAKLVSKLPEDKRHVLETTTMCLSRFVHHDVAEQILVRCV